MLWFLQLSCLDSYKLHLSFCDIFSPFPILFSQFLQYFAYYFFFILYMTPITNLCISNGMIITENRTFYLRRITNFQNVTRFLLLCLFFVCLLASLFVFLCVSPRLYFSNFNFYTKLLFCQNLT
jgi:hypothetical protein